eukprot:gnl/Ergobibamus_cyprinoides/489.p1 GENE.gnl/Ergobibamus_cyprinoides/489~~gnl/Ergobibamus_cyprinoides/489.p1  ORF type:complete len:157 (+),score=27.26 gnl/Ergobibamus_cyprinoides/489:272-742(+)
MSASRTPIVGYSIFFAAIAVFASAMFLTGSFAELMAVTSWTESSCTILAARVATNNAGGWAARSEYDVLVFSSEGTFRSVAHENYRDRNLSISDATSEAGERSVGDVVPCWSNPGEPALLAVSIDPRTTATIVAWGLICSLIGGASFFRATRALLR